MASSGLSRIAARYSAIASSRFPWALRALPRLLWAEDVVGLEPDRFAVFGDRLVQLPLGVQGHAEVVVGRAVVGLEPDRLAAGCDGRVEERPGLLWAAQRPQQFAEAGQVVSVPRAQADQVLEHGDRLVRLPLLLQQVRQLVGRLRADRAGRRVEADRVVTPVPLLAHPGQVIVDPDVAGMAPLRRAEHCLGRRRIAGTGQGRAQQVQADRAQRVEPLPTGPRLAARSAGPTCPSDPGAARRSPRQGSGSADPGRVGQPFRPGPVTAVFAGARPPSRPAPPPGPAPWPAGGP